MYEYNTHVRNAVDDAGKAFLDLLLDLEHERRRSGLKARHAM